MISRAYLQCQWRTEPAAAPAIPVGRRTDAVTVLIRDIASCKQLTATHQSLSLSSNTSCKHDTKSHTCIHTCTVFRKECYDSHDRSMPRAPALNCNLLITGTPKEQCMGLPAVHACIISCVSGMSRQSRQRSQFCQYVVQVVLRVGCGLSVSDLVVTGRRRTANTQHHLDDILTELRSLSTLSAHA